MIAAKQICLIAAMDRNRGIGMNGQLPWHLPDDLKQFKAVTMGKPLIMGRKTFAAIGRPLPGRQNIVISRDPEFSAEGVSVCNSLDQAVAVAEGDSLMVAGGGMIYLLAMPYADKMILTLVDCEVAADTWFPEWQPDEWVTISEIRVPADEINPYSFRMLELRRL